MPKRQAHPPLVIALCRALVEMGASRRTAYWLSIDRVREALGVPLEELDQAVAYAVAHHLVRADGLPAHSLTVTYDGLMLAKKAS